MPTLDDSDYVTPAEAARRLRATPRTVNAFIRREAIPVLQLGKRDRRVKWADVEAKARTLAN